MILDKKIAFFQILFLQLIKEAVPFLVM